LALSHYDVQRSNGLPSLFHQQQLSTRPVVSKHKEPDEQCWSKDKIIDRQRRRCEEYVLTTAPDTMM